MRGLTYLGRHSILSATMSLLTANDERELLRGNTPTLVLATLADTPRHGYEIAREINRRSRNALQFKQGTLYPALHALERDGFIEGMWEMSEPRPRKVYALTDAGRAELVRRQETWRQFTTAVGDVLDSMPDVSGGSGNKDGGKGGSPDEQPA